jgi:hypothetical protein
MRIVSNTVTPISIHIMDVLLSFGHSLWLPATLGTQPALNLQPNAVVAGDLTRAGTQNVLAIIDMVAFRMPLHICVLSRLNIIAQKTRNTDPDEKHHPSGTVSEYLFEHRLCLY